MAREREKKRKQETVLESTIDGPTEELYDEMILSRF